MNNHNPRKQRQGREMEIEYRSPMLSSLGIVSYGKSREYRLKLFHFSVSGFGIESDERNCDSPRAEEVVLYPSLIS